MRIASEMQIDVFHRHDLGIAASGCAAFHAETGPQRRLAQAGHRALAETAEAVHKADRCGRLALPRGRRRDRGDQDELAVRAVFQAVDEIVGKLGFVRAIVEERIAGNVDLAADLGDRLHFCVAGYLDIAANYRHARLFFAYRSRSHSVTALAA